MLNLGHGLYALRIGVDYYIVRMITRKEWRVFPVGTSAGTLVHLLAAKLEEQQQWLGDGLTYHCSFKEMRRRLYVKGLV